MKKLPVDVSSFIMMIEDNYLYIDKTEYIYNIISSGRLYFLSRPRRFGKSLLISTLKELFLGNRTLFKNLWIDSSDYQWPQHPVIHLDFTKIDRLTSERFETSLAWHLEKIGKQYHIDLSLSPTLSDKFNDLIEELAKIDKVVLLIDEYDKPILDHLADPEKAIAMRSILKNFYDVLKGVEGNLRAIFITGVTKFAKTSIFSGLNNLNDLTLDERASALLGYTKNELEHYFHPYIEKLATTLNISVPDAYGKIKTYYNGYRFSNIEQSIYNPFSLIRCLHAKNIKSHWFETGTPSHLIKILKTQTTKTKNIKDTEFTHASLESVNINAINLIPILFQTGYLTIKNHVPLESNNTQEDYYLLGCPNAEVQQAFTALSLLLTKREFELIVQSNI